ncbi:MAG: cyclic nucleotide-binding domain-containing protein [Planctomycetes bacterium]|nr:cyclic nucleotide-binding domain-containing protein [Planctomycetota bacterium]
MKHMAFGMTDTGRTKENNQDAVLLADNLGLYLVCDGVSQGAAGELASKTACDLVYQMLRDHREILDACRLSPTGPHVKSAMELIESAVQFACLEIYSAGRHDRSKAGMCTTLVMLVVMGQHAVAASVGDSRIYLLRQDKMFQLTEDHTLANQQVKNGRMSPDEARGSKAAATLTRAIGFQPSVQVDMLHFALVEADAILLCSDGLSQYLRRNDFPDLCQTLGPQQTPQALVELANARGGADNISAVVVQIEGQPSDAGKTVVQMVDTLKRCPLFSQMSYRELLQVMDAVTLRNFQTGERIISEAEQGDTMYVSLSGQVEVRKWGQRLAELPAGSSFGEMSLVGKAKRTADVFAVEPVRVMSIRRDDLFAMLRINSHLAVKFLWGMCRVLHQRLQATSEELSYALTSQDLQELADIAWPISETQEELPVADQPADPPRKDPLAP